MSDQSTEETTEAPTAEAPAKTKKDPVPDGWETPVNFAKRLTANSGSDVRPQIVYGYIRNSKGFPSKQNTDGHYLVNIEEGLKWMEEKAARKAAREAEKAAKAAAPAEAS